MYVVCVPQYLLRHFCTVAKNWFVHSRKEVSSDNSHFITVWPSGGGSFRQIIKEVKTENHTGAAKKLFLHLI